METTYTIIFALLAVCTGAAYILLKKKKKKNEKISPLALKSEVKPEIIIAPKKEIAFSERLKLGLSRSRQEVWGKLGALFSVVILSMKEPLIPLKNFSTVLISELLPWEN